MICVVSMLDKIQNLKKIYQTEYHLLLLFLPADDDNRKLTTLKRRLIPINNIG